MKKGKIMLGILSVAAACCMAFTGCASEARGILSIEKTATDGLTDTYTVYYTDGTTSTFEVTNGADGAEKVRRRGVRKTRRKRGRCPFERTGYCGDRGKQGQRDGRERAGKTLFVRDEKRAERRRQPRRGHRIYHRDLEYFHLTLSARNCHSKNSDNFR